MSTMVVEGHLNAWSPRRRWLDPMVADSMCAINRGVKDRPDGASLALVRPRKVAGLLLVPHPGWTDDEQRKIDAYVNQLDLLDGRDRTPLQAPRFKATYRYWCHDATCRGHEQGLLDWEFVTLQRRLARLSDDDLCRELEAKFFTMMCSPDRDTAFYVGNQAKRVNVFSILGVYYPQRH